VQVTNTIPGSSMYQEQPPLVQFERRQLATIL